MKVKSKSLPEQIKEALDGRSQRWLSRQIGLTDDAMSRRMNSILKFTDEEISNIKKILGVEIVA